MKTYREARPSIGIGVAVALLAGLHKAVLTSTPVNDDFMHLAYARQLLQGDLPLRDFWDLSTTLMYVLSAVSQLIFGHRLLAEAVIIGVCAAIATFLVFRVVQDITGSSKIAALCAVLFVVAVPRAYAYPKWIVYAVAAYLWWQYVWQPTLARALGLGAWAAVAFYWRHDHGVGVFIGLVLAMVAAHGFDRNALRRAAAAGVVAVALTAPYLAFVAVQLGLVNFARNEIATVQGEHTNTHAELRWPLRMPADLLRREPPEAYAPELTVRWRSDASADARAAALARYGLTPIAQDGPRSERLRLSAHSLDSLRALIDDPVIEDTAGVERSRAAFSWSQWPLWYRLRFRVAPLQFSMLPGIDQQLAAGAAAAMILHAVPLLAALLAGPSLRRALPPAITPRQVLLFAVFAAVVNVALLREPYESRAADVIVLPAVLCGVLLAVLVRHTASMAKWPLRVLAVAFVFLLFKSFAVAGDFTNRVEWLMGEERSPERAAGAWREVAARLLASPPSQFWAGKGGPVTVRLAEYAQRCLAPTDRTLALWFAPEIHYNADRLMAGRHLYYFPTFGNVKDEQERELEKVIRSAPKIVFANRNNYAAAAAAFPGVVDYIERNYVTAVAFEEDGDRYTILIPAREPPAGRDRETGWPCYGGSVA
jgi:hypothetical protein